MFSSQSFNSIVHVIDLPCLASEINDAHRQVTFHARSMLLEAKRAGDALIEAKKMVAHGEFKAWIETNCRCSYRSAAEYMKVSRLSINADLRTFEGGVRAFLDVHSTPRKAAIEAPRDFTHSDAEYALKLAAMVDRGCENESSVAARLRTY